MTTGRVRAWILVLAAAGVAAATVVVVSAVGPEWPETFAACSDEPGRPAAIAEWRDWLLPVYLRASPSRQR